MWLNINFIIIFFQLIIRIFSEDTLYTLSTTGEKGVAVTSFTKDLYLLSSIYKYNIINSNYNSIKNNSNSNTANTNLYKNFVMLEASINTNTNESVFLIAENDERKNKINLYSLNITSTINNQNPKLIYSTQCTMHNSKVSLINAGIDKYVLSYIKNENCVESIWFKYTYYLGFEILRTFTNNILNIISGISCFLLYDQFPICFYSTKDITTTTEVYKLNVMAFDIVLTWKYPEIRSKIEQISYSYNNKITFTKAIYLSNDHAVFCFFEENQNLICDVIKLKLDFELFNQLTLSTGLTSKYENSNCKNDIDKIDVLKIAEDKFIVGCVNSDNQPIIDIITITDSNSDDIFDAISSDRLNLNSHVKSTLSLFIHEVTYETDFYGIIFNDANDNRLKYAYLNLPYCTKKADNPIKSISVSEDEPNTFKFEQYLDIITENVDFNKYKIISFFAQDDDHNYFNYEILKNDNTKISQGESGISPSDELKIKPLTENEYHSGKFFVEVAPVNSVGITGKSCFFEFDTICYEGCSTCNNYDSEATSTTKHNCVSCKSSFYSLGDLCLSDCSLIPGFYNVYTSKTCKVHELEVVIDCPYDIWSISQEDDNNICSSSSFCPKELPYVYSLSGECIKSCRYSEFKEGECLISNIIGGGKNAIEIINTEIKNEGNYVFNYLDEDKINKSVLMYGLNITIEITDTSRLQKDINRKLDVSQIMNMTSCENSLRHENTISDNDEIIILKIDLRRNDTASTQVEYQLYYLDATGKYTPFDSLSGCDSIFLQVPLWLTDDYKKKIVELYSQKIDIFDINQKFYTDLCFPYHAVDFDADLTLGKRQRVFYYYNANLCEKRCTFIDIDLNTFQAICECPLKTSIDLDRPSEDLFDYVEQKDQKILHDEKISNFKSMKCFKYIFSKDGFRGNWGSYFMMLMILGFIIVGIIWFHSGQDIILTKIRVLLDYILIKLGIKYDDKFRKKFEELKQKFKNNELNEDDITPPENGKISNNDIKIYNIEQNNDIIQNDNNKNAENGIVINKDKNKGNDIEFIRKKGPKNNVFLHRSVIVNKDHSPDVIIDEKKEKNEYLTDIEKDLLTYERAKILDDRTFCGYYWSLLKLRQLIIFTFFSFEDFNIFIIKLLSIFLLLSFNLVYNAVFFFDKIIDEIYDDRGEYSMKLQILNIFISSILFSFTIILIRFIITSHKKLIKLKNMEIYEEAQKESFSIHKSLIIKYIIYYIVGSILLIVFWYFITSFCAIFHYTQNHLFLNAFISFCFSMIYPFIYLLIPAWFRYLALRKNYEKFYCISQNI